MTSFYVVSTPIGNLKDITLRALEILNSVDYILSEDTRQTKKLVNHYDIKTKLLSFHSFSDRSKIEKVIALLKEGNNMALVSDAGTPLISDPGNNLIDAILKETGDVKVIPVPGPSSVTSCLSCCNFSVDKFSFLGFLPRKKKRNKTLNFIKESGLPVVFFESLYRIEKTLQNLVDLYNEDPEKDFDIVICRELTKIYETVIYSNKENVMNDLKDTTIKGEFVVAIRNKIHEEE